jgi:hypothetical protein
MIRSKTVTSILICSYLLLFICFVPPRATGLTADKVLYISTGEPILSGSLGGWVKKNNSSSTALSMMVNFGELSPINRSRIIKITVPVTVHGNPPYEVSVSATLKGDPFVLKLSDIGFGMQNLRQVGSKAAARPTINSRFDNDPSISVKRNRRASYTSSLADIGASTVILKAPKLGENKDEIGWTFDAMLTVVPQFYPPGQFSITVSFVTLTTPNN